MESPLRPALRCSTEASVSPKRLRFAVPETPPLRSAGSSADLPYADPLTGGAAKPIPRWRPRGVKPAARKRSPTRDETVERLVGGASLIGGDTPSTTPSTTDTDTDADEGVDARPGEAFLVELFDRDKERGRMQPVGRTKPRSRLSGAHLRTLARYSVKKLNGSNFFLLWRVIKDELCTVHLGTGTYGSVFRVCKDDGCASCIAVKFGIAMNADGTVPLDAVGTKPHGMSDAEWAAGVQRYTLELGPTLNYDGVSLDEVRNTQAVTRTVYDSGMSPHVMRYLHHFSSHGGLFLFLEYVAPWLTTPARVASLDDLINAERGGPILAAMPGDAFKSLMFQAVYTVAALQAAFPGFRHNDTKPDNWGVARWDGGAHTYGVRTAASRPEFVHVDGRKREGEGEGPDVLELVLQGGAHKHTHKKGNGKGKSPSRSPSPSRRRSPAPTLFTAWQLPRQRAMLKLLDFGIAHSSVPAVYTADIAYAHDVGKVGPHFLEFGTVPDPCVLYDLHLLFNLLLRGIRRLASPPPWLPEFEAFVYGCIPRDYFLPPHVSTQYRLTVAAQGLLMRDVAARRARGPVSMLMHPYFDEFRMEGASASAAEYKFMAGRASM